MAGTPSIAQLAEGVGLLQRLDPLRADQALSFLRELSEPGVRWIDGKLLYSAAFLGDNNGTQEALQL